MPESSYKKKIRGEAYSIAFILDYSLNYLVDLLHKNSLTPPPNFTYELLEKDSIKELVNLKNFDNSLHVNEDTAIEIQLSLVAKSDNQLVAVASANNVGLGSGCVIRLSSKWFNCLFSELS